ncbi:hypothetical protein LCGC14_2542610, partial [marine sediment metagenome]
MELAYKQDWEQTKQRYRTWWAHEAVGRAAIAVTAPRDDPPPIAQPPRPATPEQYWTDLDYMSAVSEYRIARTFFGGEAFPLWGHGYPGNKSLGVFLGCPINLAFDTGWIDPLLAGEDIDCSRVGLDEDEPHFQFTLRWLRRCARDAAGKAVAGVGAFGG